MASARGVSLIETLLVMGMLALVLAGSGFMTLADLRHAQERDDREQLEGALMLARSRSQHDSRPYGVHADADAATVFAGSSYESRDRARDIAFPRMPGQSGRPEEIVFRDGVPISGSSYTFDPSAVTVSETGRICAPPCL